MDRHQIAPALLAFSLSASTLAERPDQSVRLASQLRALGVGVGVGGMGPAGVALTTLQRLHPAWLALDASLVASLPDDPVARGTADAVLALARQLGVPAVAVGLESAEARGFLKNAGWDQVQQARLGSAPEAGEITPLMEAMAASPKVAVLHPRNTRD